MIQESHSLHGALNFQQAMASQLMQDSLQGRPMAQTSAPAPSADAGAALKAVGKGLRLDITV